MHIDFVLIYSQHLGLISYFLPCYSPTLTSNLKRERLILAHSSGGHSQSLLVEEAPSSLSI